MEHLGGQAVIEGVMIRKKNAYSLAVRSPNGKIIVSKRIIKDKRKGILSIFKLPFFRGMYSMYEMLNIGMKTLFESSNISIGNKKEEITGKEMAFLVIVSFFVVVLFFILLPYLLTALIGINEQKSPVIFNIIDAIIKTAFFIMYVYGISMFKDVKRIFQYHGAEHKVVNCYEAGKKVTVKNAKKFSTQHVRCGSSFIMFVILVSIFLFSLLPIAIYPLYAKFGIENRLFQKGILFLLRILMIPVIIGVSYEILKFAGKYSSSAVSKFISYPGIALQKLTTAEPDKKQIEVAIAAFKKIV